MVQSGYTPQGDTAVGGNEFTPPKKKKKTPKPAPYVVPESRRDDPVSVQRNADLETAAQQTETRIERSANKYLRRHTLLNGQERQRYISSLSKRAEAIDPRLLAKNPSMAAELLMGKTPTLDLRETSSAAADGLALQAVETYHEQVRQYQLSLTENDIPQYFASQGALIETDPILREYLKKSERIENEEQRAVFVHGLINVSELPPGTERDEAYENLPIAYNTALDTGPFDDTRLEETKSLLGQLTSGVGRGVSMPFEEGAGLISDIWGGAADFAKESGIPGGSAVSKDFRKYQDETGRQLKDIATAGQWAGRQLQGGAAFLASGPTNAADLTKDQILTSWDEAKEGGPSPLSYLVADYMGTEVSDPDLQGLFAAIDLSADLVSQYFLFKGLGEIRTGLRSTEIGGGAFSGETWVNSELLGGKRFVRVGWDLIEGMPTEVRINNLMGKFKKGMTPTLARDLARATSKDEFARIAADHIDNIPDQLIIEKSNRIADIDNELVAQADYTDTGRPRYWHRTDESKLPGIQEKGILPTIKGEKPGGAVYAHDNPAHVQNWLDTTDEVGRVYVEYETDAPVVGRGTAGSEAMKTEGAVTPDQLTGRVYRPGDVLDQGGQLTSLRAAEIDALQAERIALEQEVLELSGREAVYEFPRVSHVRPLMRGVDNSTWLGRQFNAWFGESGKLDLAKWTNDLTPDDLTLIDPSELSKPRRWATHNTDALRKTMNEAKVPKAIQDIVVDDMFKVERGELSFFEWRKNIEAAYREGLGKTITAEAEKAIRVSADRSVEARMHSRVVDEVTLPNGRSASVLRALYEDEFGNPLPTRPTQLLRGEVRLPDMKVLAESTSELRHLDVWMKDHPYLGKVYNPLRVTGQAAHFALLEAPRMILRPAVLVTSIVRLALKIEFDQSIRAFLTEKVTPLKWWRKSKIDFTEAGLPVHPGTRELLVSAENPQGSPSAMGLVANEMLYDGAFTEVEVSTRGGVNQVEGKNAAAITRSVWDHVKELNADELTRRVAIFGPDATLQYLESHPNSRLARTMQRDILPKIEAAGGSLPELLAQLEREIDQGTGFDPALREAVGTGRWNVGREVQTDVARQRILIQDELVEAREALAVTNDALKRRQLNLRIEELEVQDRLLADRDVPTTHISLADDNQKEFRKAVHDNWRDGSFQMPDKVIVKKGAFRESEPGILDRSRDLAQSMNRAIYKGFKPLTKATYDMSRGSTFRAVTERVYTRLIEQGWDPRTAFAEAQSRALFITKDLHYDISARSSMDRKMQNYFWFAPVWREQLLTYLWKVPQKAFWASGLALEFGMARTFIDGLKELGLAEERVTYVDPDTGEQTKALFIGGLDVSTLDPLSPGTETGRPPTLAPGAETILDFTARWDSLPGPVQEFVKGVSEFFTFDKDVTHGANFIPRSLLVIPEFFGVHIPTETFSNWFDYDAKVDRQVADMAEQKLADEGVENPTDAQLATARREIEKGIFAVHLLSAAVVPGKIVTPGTDPWYSYREQSILNEGNYVDLALRQTQGWEMDAPAPDLDPANNIVDFKSLSPRQQATRAAAWTQIPAEDLTLTQRQVIGENTDFLPARRMANAGYFTGETAGWSLAKADSIRSRIIAAGNSPNGYAEDTIKLKIAFYHRIDELRQQNPNFDRQMRYLELGVAGEDFISRVVAYERIFFGEPYSSVVVDTLEGAY